MLHYYGETMKRKSRKLFDLKRREPSREEYPSILIVSEGENTEPSYFRQFRLTTAEVIPLGIGYNTMSLVNKAIELRDKKVGTSHEYNQVWCVFDKDDYSDDQYNSAIFKATQNDVKVAYSNQSFEYWLLLHLKDHQGGALHRDNYNKEINNLLPQNVKYDGKGSKLVSADLFKHLLSKDLKTGKTLQELAIRRAKKLHQLKDSYYDSFAKQESMTTVYKLVEELLKFC
ncbi:hypothetical protein Bcop_1845 [Bacteroides coprosuis DSM 18011]|uniref:Abortive phage resistance protein n=1 Tax=Bacteroides coprosuis DSM 18011 TaxID=679937 RepID=F3ZRU4_9BACE|nr:hypothetical protein Bcop_1845 [Bacteroides coprosuis DSM 18011]